MEQRWLRSAHGLGGMVLAGLMLSLTPGAGLGLPPPVALPPAEDLPEEVLVQELILQGRSPRDGAPLSPEDYAALAGELGEFPAGSVAVSPELQSLLAQLKLLKLLRDIVPFW